MQANFFIVAYAKACQEKKAAKLAAKRLAHREMIDKSVEAIVRSEALLARLDYKDRFPERYFDE